MYGTTRFVASLGNEVGGGTGMRAYIYIHVTAGGVFFQGLSGTENGKGTGGSGVYCTYIQTYSVCM